MSKWFKIDFFKIEKVLFFGILFLFVCALGIRYNSLDVDIWARLINGGFVVNTFLPLYKDIFSYTQTHTWIDPEWLSSASIFLVQKYFGICGLTILKCLLFFAMLCSIIFAIRKLNLFTNCYNLPFFALISIIGTQMGYLAFTTRCQLYTFIIMAFWIFCLEQIRKNRNNYIYFLPFLMLIWLNVHGGCIAGVGILILYIIGEFLNKRNIKKYIFALVLLIPVFFINPWGADYISFLYDSAFLDRSVINEWNSSFKFFSVFKNSYFYYLIILLFPYFVNIFHKWSLSKSMDKTKFILVFVLLYLSILHSKHIGLAIVVFTIILFKDFVRTIMYIKNALNLNSFTTRFFKVMSYLLVFTYSFLVLTTTPCIDSHKMDFETSYPGFMLEFLKANNIKGKILTSFQHGSYIAYKYYPDFKIYMDGRQEQVYFKSTFDNLISFLDQKGENPNYIIDCYEPDIVLLSAQNTSQEFLLNTVTTLANSGIKTIVMASNYSTNQLIKTLRCGASDFLSLPIIKDNLISALNKVGKTSLKGTKSNIISIYSNKGGIGKTAIAMNLAVEFARQTREKVVLVDLNLPLGDVTTFVNIRPNMSLLSAIENAEHNGAEAIMDACIQYKDSSLYVLAEPMYMEENLNLGPKHILKLFEFLRANLIDYVNIVIAPILVGGTTTNTLIDGMAISSVEELNKLKALKLMEIHVLQNSYIQLKYKVINNI